VWRAQLSEKKLVSPAKKTPSEGASDSLVCASVGNRAGNSKTELDAEGCGSDHAGCAGALHHASSVAPALTAIPSASEWLASLGISLSFGAGAGSAQV